MNKPLGDYPSLRGDIDGFPQLARKRSRRLQPTADQRQTLGLCLFVAATLVPVLVAGVVVIALHLLS